jgi:hypothetical protein
MRLDKITVALRPRSVWEAIDLGFGMARLWWGPLLKSWLLLALPVFVLLNVILYDYPFVASLLFWWLKPAYEQMPLVYLSRSLFQQSMNFRERLRALPKIATRQVIANLTWRRLSPIRSFTAPIAQLERLSGKQRQQRLQVLENGYSGGGWLTVVGMHLEAILYFSILLLVWFVMPEQFEFDVWLDKHRMLLEIGGNVAYFAAAAIIAPFYVSSGFSLYLNRRAQLEGWDIELEFRQIQERLGKHRVTATGVAASILGCVLLLGLHIPDVSAKQSINTNTNTNTNTTTTTTPTAQNPPTVSLKKAKQLIDDVLANEDFGKKKTITTWKYKGDLSPEEQQPERFHLNLDFLRFFAQIGEYLLWILVAVIIIIVLYNLPRWKLALNKPSRHQTRSEPPPQVLFGLDITEESLPDNIAEEAWQLFQNKEVRRSLSLLYRGSLAVLVNHHGVALKDSNTEGECAANVSQSQPDTIAAYFNELTNAWIRLAYGHQVPAQETVQDLCAKWPVHFGSAP